jgi:hypothetical protein
MAKNVRSNGSRPGKSIRTKISKKNGAKNGAKPSVGTAAKARGPGGRPKGGAPARSGGSLADLPTEILARELARRRNELPKLERRRAELMAALAEVESRIAALGGSSKPTSTAARAASAPKRTPAGGGAGAPRRERKGAPTLGARLLAYLTAHPGTHQPGALAEAIAAETGRPCNQSFIVSTNATLRKLIAQGVVEKVSRGLYQAKGTADAATA